MRAEVDRYRQPSIDRFNRRHWHLSPAWWQLDLRQARFARSVRKSSYGDRVQRTICEPARGRKMAQKFRSHQSTRIAARKCVRISPDPGRNHRGCSFRGILRRGADHLRRNARNSCADVENFN